MTACSRIPVRSALLLALVLSCIPGVGAAGGTVALWLFDEQEGIYPSSILSDASANDFFLVLGRGGQITEGRWGRGLRAVPPPPFAPSIRGRQAQEEFTNAGSFSFGLQSPPRKPGRTVEPMTWFNATFAAAFVNGDEHLRRAPFPHPTKGGLNLGRADFTVEFWLRVDRGAEGEGVVLEVGSGPRGENNVVTRLSLDVAAGEFRLRNEPAGATVRLATDVAALQSGWRHCAVVYDAARSEMRHYLDGRLRAKGAARLKPLPEGPEDYFTVARDGVWGRPLAGVIDELRISEAVIYGADFPVPGSLSRRHGSPRPPLVLKQGPPLQFGGGRPVNPVVELGGNKHLFIDGALLAESHGLTFRAHPARIEEIVIDQGTGWSTVIEDENGLIRLYGEGRSGVAVWTSKDGVKFTAPDFGGGRGNQVAAPPARRGSVFIDPNGPAEERWKLFAGSHERGGFYMYTSPDGWSFRRNEVTALPFWAGSASTIYYDDQRRLYVAHHRMDYARTPGGKTERYFLRTEVTEPMDAWPFTPVTEARKAEFRAFMRLGDTVLDPWWLDNGPLSPGGFSIEYPVAMGPDPALDPVATDVYNTRAMKYPGAPDTYVAFPLWFFHYPDDGPPTRQFLAHPSLGLGTGLVETQLAVSRDGIEWTRYPRPAYIPVGNHKGLPMLRPYIAFGMVRRGEEIWQYSYTRTSYHDAHKKQPDPGVPGAVVQRLSQRLDGFVSLDAPYEREGAFVSHLLRFDGSRLRLNVDAGATGYVQVGFEDEQGRPIPGFGVDDCLYINGNFVEHEVAWLRPGQTLARDVSELAGRPVRLVARLRGSSLYAFQFVRPGSGDGKW